ncbi:MAG: hypothetical protein E7042_03670 [Lentisphaerae bacterium]|nr:hypothetical protein [Lentisphaerota bacterium]
MSKPISTGREPPIKGWIAPSVFATHYFTSGEAPIPYLDARFRCRFIPIHEWEFSHRPADTPGAATQCFAELQSVYAEPYAAGRAQSDLGRKYRAGLKQVFISCNQILSPPGSPMKSFAKHIPYPAWLEWEMFFTLS